MAGPSRRLYESLRCGVLPSVLWQSPDDVIYELQAQNIEINTFTVNDADSVKRLMQKGVDIVIGNFPDMVHRVLKG